VSGEFEHAEDTVALLATLNTKHETA